MNLKKTLNVAMWEFFLGMLLTAVQKFVVIIYLAVLLHCVAVAMLSSVAVHLSEQSHPPPHHHLPPLFLLLPFFPSDWALQLTQVELLCMKRLISTALI